MNDQKYILRPCRQDEFEDIYEIVNDAAIAYKGVIPDDRWHEPYMPREELQHEMDAGVAFSGCEVDGVLAGVMGMQPVKDVTLIRHAYVRTAMRRGGIGGSLLDYLLEKAQGTLLVGTWAAAHWAVSFYEKHGFRNTTWDEKEQLLRIYWNIPERQVETSVVLRMDLSE